MSVGKMTWSNQLNHVSSITYNMLGLASYIILKSYVWTMFNLGLNLIKAFTVKIDFCFV